MLPTPFDVVGGFSLGPFNSALYLTTSAAAGASANTNAAADAAMNKCLEYDMDSSLACLTHLGSGKCRCNSRWRLRGEAGMPTHGGCGGQDRGAVQPR